MKWTAILAGLTVGVGLICGTASADVLFSNLDSNDSSTGSSTIVNASYTLAGDFTVSGGDFFLTSIEVVVANFHNPPNTVDASIRADNAGTPGTTLESFSFTGDLDFADSNSPKTIKFNSVLNPPLVDGATYWIALTSGNPDKSILWKNNSIGDNRNAQRDFGNDNTWEPAEFSEPAFRVRGAVPEPAVLALVWLFPLLAGRRRTLSNLKRGDAG
jgi:hypothetical protein